MRKTEKSGKQIAPGVWQLKTNEFLLRIQPKDPTTGKKRNVRRLLVGVSRNEALDERARLMGELTSSDASTTDPMSWMTTMSSAATMSSTTTRTATRSKTVATPSEVSSPPVTPSVPPGWALVHGPNGPTWVPATALSSGSPNAPTTVVSTTTMSLPTLRTFATSWLAKKVARGDLERQTRERYVVALDRLSKRLLDKRLDELTPDDVEQWMLASRAKGFAPGTVNSRRNVLVTVLNAARREHGLSRNVAHEVRPLRETRDLEDRNAATPEELRALLVWLRSHERMLYVVALTQALTGLRWGEVSALRWEALDVDARVLHVRRKVVRGEELPTTKTNRARLVGVPRALLDELVAYRAWVEAEKLPGRERGLVFFSNVGTPLGSARISQALREAREAVGLRSRLTSHGLRRTVTDLLRQAGVDPVVAKSLVGHTTDRMREHYSFVRPAEVRDAADRVAGLVFGDAQ